MATRPEASVHARLLAFVDDLLDEASLPIHLKREARADFMAHLEADVAAAKQQGMTEAEAVESAIRSFGHISDVRGALLNAADASASHGRDWAATALENIACDVRDAVRSVWSRRTTAAIAVLTLALGIGITAAAYALFDWVLVRPLPYPASHELARVFAAGTTPVTAPSDLTYSEFEAVTRATGVRRAFGFSSATRMLAAGAVEPTHVLVVRVAGDLFGTLGISTRVGRGFTLEEIAAGAPNIVLSERFWRAAFNAANVVNQTATIDGVLYTIVGVMPAGRGYPADADLWRPLSPAEREDDDQEIVTIARRKDGVTLAAANAEIGALASGVTRGSRTGWLEDMQATDVRDVRGALSMLMALSGLILLIACTNVAALLGGRSVDRVGELAMRGALGASRARLMQQLLVEHLLLAMTGAAAGFAIARWTLDALRALAPVTIPRLDEVSIDGRIFLAGLLTSVCIGLAIGLAIAIRTTRQPLATTIQLSGSARATPPRLTARTLTALQAAIAVVLVMAAVLFGRALRDLVQINHGFDPENLLALHLYMRGPGTPEPRKVFPQLIDAANAVSGVTAAAVALRLPTQIASIRTDLEVPGQSKARVIVRPITPAYFEVARIPVLHGRAFTSADAAGAARVLVVNQAFTRDVLRGANALGVRATIDLVDEPLTIVGVVGDVTPAAEADRPAIYIALDQLSVAGGSLLVRTMRPPGAVLPELRARLRAVVPTFPLDRVTVVADALADGRATTRFLTQLATAFGLVAFILAALGVYGLTCREIAARWRELAVRQALGASPRRVLWQTLRPGTMSLVVGGTAGAMASLAARQWISSWLSGIAPLTTVVVATVPALLVIIGTLVALTATRRVLAGDPSALR